MYLNSAALQTFTHLTELLDLVTQLLELKSSDVHLCRLGNGLGSSSNAGVAAATHLHEDAEPALRASKV